MYADNLSLFFSFLSLHLCLCLRRPGLHIRCNATSASTRERKSFHSLVLVLMLVSLRHTCKPEQRKHKHKRRHKALMLASHWFARRFLVLMLATFVQTRLKELSVSSNAHFAFKKVSQTLCLVASNYIMFSMAMVLNTFRVQPCLNTNPL